jgi:hypothetical protein
MLPPYNQRQQPVWHHVLPCIVGGWSSRMCVLFAARHARIVQTGISTNIAPGGRSGRSGTAETHHQNRRSETRGANREPPPACFGSTFRASRVILATRGMFSPSVDFAGSVRASVWLRSDQFGRLKARMVAPGAGVGRQRDNESIISGFGRSLCGIAQSRACNTQPTATIGPPVHQFLGPAGRYDRCPCSTIVIHADCGPGTDVAPTSAANQAAGTRFAV